MFVPSLLTLAIAIVTLYISIKVTDEVVQLAIALPALFCLFLSLVLAPWPIKLLIVTLLLISKKTTNTLIQTHLKVRVSREMALKCEQPCCYALQKKRVTWRLPTTPTPFLLAQSCPYIPSVVCIPAIQVSPN